MVNLRTRYPGAQPFSDDEISRETFFGREHESAHIANNILANRLVVVYAKSGLGKTSLLNAGVSPLLRNEQCLPLIVRVNDVQHGPFMSILEGIRTAAERQGVEYVPGSQDSLWHFFKTAEFWQGDLLLTPVLILDQFEELFTLQSVRTQEAFLSDLGSLVRGIPPATTPQTNLNATKSGDLHSELTEKPPALRIVLSLREDYLGFLEGAAGWIPQILDHRFRLTPLSTEGAKEALECPAKVKDNSFQTKPFTYAPEAVRTIINHLSRRSVPQITVGHVGWKVYFKGLFRRSGQLTTHMTGYVEPFQLQLICQRIERIVMERQQTTDSALTITMADIGGEAALRETLRDFYKQEIRALSTWRHRRAARRLCEEYLISPAGRRLSIENHEIHRKLKLPEEVLRKLVDRRLLRADQRADSTYYELSHDTLVEPVLATRRVRAGVLGILSMIGGSLFLLLFIALSISDTYAYAYAVFSNYMEGNFSYAILYALGLLVILLIYTAAIYAYIRLIRWGAQTTRRYLSRNKAFISGTQRRRRAPQSFFHRFINVGDMR